MSYVLGLQWNSQKRASHKTNSALVFGLIGARVTLFVMLSLLGLYIWWDKNGGNEFMGLVDSILVCILRIMVLGLN